MTTLDFDDSQTYELLLTICAQYQVDPSASLESEKFFRNLLAQYNGSSDVESLSKWLSEQINHWFIALGERPKWIQSSEWKFVDGIPAIFAGQIDVSTEGNEMVPKIFHDDTSFYVFIGKKKPPIVIMQQY
jgi:hypothetical protein